MEEQQMADSYDRYDNNDSGGGGFMMGLLTGAVIGAGLGLLLAPKAGAELRGTIGEQAKNFGSMASDQYRKASEQAGTWAEKGKEQAGAWAEKGKEVVGKAREAVARGAEEARTYAGSTAGDTAGSTFGTASQGSFGGNTGSTGTTDFNRS